MSVRNTSSRAGGYSRIPRVSEASSIPTSTYRLQFHGGFTFADATGILDYLQALGISHVYSSPFFQAGSGSTHGYDVADHSRINPAIGGEERLAEFMAGLRGRGMGQILDFVPNHMGISEPINRWWMDVLENGPCSPYANYFDIEWRPLKQELENRVLLPILGDRYGRVLEKGDFSVVLENGAFFLRYYEAKLPINPRSYPQILDRAAEQLKEFRGTAFHDELRSISTAFGALPQRWHSDLEAIELRAREKEVGKRRLARLVADVPKVGDAIASVIAVLAGQVGAPESFDALHDLLSAQAYRLAYWRVAAEEINYRRFFDINTLAAIRAEIPEVFAAAHERVFKMIEAGEVTGLRIDHIDGLWNPRTYLEQLRDRFPKIPLYLIVEKILAGEEWLPSDWPVHGTTGYEFASDTTALFVDPASEQKLTELYARFADETNLEDLIYEKKLLITRMALAGEVATLGRMLNQLSESDRHHRDFTLNQLTAAVRETIACFPVYRTYVTPERPARDDDRLVILRSVRRARSRNHSIDKPVFDFLARVLLLDFPKNLPEKDREEQIRFALKFQQVSGPVMAKGLEDTAFYIYNRLIALNEVGGEPGRFGLPVTTYHERCAERQRRTPHCLLASSTHDTKRSEDMRARLTVISEFPDDWRKAVLKWADLNAPLKRKVDGRPAPSPNEEYLIYQTLAGVWPLEGLDENSRPGFVTRIQEYMGKAVKEAKLNSSWVEPNEDWENAIHQFVAEILDPEKSRKFLKLLEPFVERLAPIGAINSLAQQVLKCTAPGVPDIYQGSEIWDFSLVDPDNRRPVDYARRQQVMASLEGATPATLLKDWKSGAIKLFITQRLLHLRRESPEFFRAEAVYEGLAPTGMHAGRLVAFKREAESGALAVVVPRLIGALGFPATGKVWKDTALPLAAGTWREVFTGRTILSTGSVLLAEIFGQLPVAVLVGPKAG